LSVLQQQAQSEQLSREVIAQRIGEIKVLQKNFETTMLAAVTSPLAEERPKQAGK
jgi:hypothetical protein